MKGWGRFPYGILSLVIAALVGGSWVSGMAQTPGRRAQLDPADQSPVSVARKPPVTFPGPPARAQAAPRRLPLYFVENHGQADNTIKYYLANPGHSLAFTRDGVLFSLAKDPRTLSPHLSQPKPAASSLVARLEPVGMQPSARMEGLEQQEGYVNYLIGDDPSKWRTNIPTFRAVAYREAYPGVDLKFYGSDVYIEYDVIVKPGADPSQVKFSYPEAVGLSVTPVGDLHVRLRDGGILVQKKPSIYQEITGQRIAREGRFTLYEEEGRSTFGFQVAAYDVRYPLVIDPTMLWGTYLGGHYLDAGYGITVDAGGNTYVTGVTGSIFVGIGTDLTELHAFVAKIDPSGSNLLNLTLLGDDIDIWIGRAIAVGLDGCAYITGTHHDRFFVAKINPSGTSILYKNTALPTTTHYQGLSFGLGIAVDNNGFAYVTGGGFDYSGFPQEPWFVGKVKQDGKGFEYFTMGTDKGVGNAIALDSFGNAYVAGAKLTESGSGMHALLLGLNQQGEVFLSETWGGSGVDEAFGIALDQLHHVYIAGVTSSKDLAVTGTAPQPHYGGGSWDAFVAKYSAFEYPGSPWAFATYLGGSGEEAAHGIAVSNDGIYITGSSNSTDFPLLDEWSGKQGVYSDAFVAKLNLTDGSLAYSTFLGSGCSAIGYAIAVHPGEAYITGQINGDTPLFPGNSIQPYFGGTADAFVVKFGDVAPSPPFDFSLNIYIPFVWLHKTYDPSSMEAIQLVILSAPGFDATQVNPVTVTLNGGLARVNPNGKPHFVHRDVNGDGLVDLQVWVSKASMTPLRRDSLLTVQARTFGGASLTGTLGTRPR